MHKIFLATTAVGLLAASGAGAATYIPVTPPAGSVSTIVYGINDDNAIAGAYTDSSGVEHGFFGPLNGTYTTFDYGNGQGGTEPRGIANDGSIAGFAPGGRYLVGVEFFRTKSGEIRTFTINGAPLDGVAQGIDGRGINMGDYYDITAVRLGYFGSNGKYKKDFNLHIKAWVQSSPRQRNALGAVAGYFIDKKGGTHGFIQQGRVAQVIDYPDPDVTGTVLEGINDNGVVSGQWNDASANPHAFTLETSTGRYKILNPGDGSIYQQSWGINNKGLVALSTSNNLSFIYCPLRAAKCPGGGGDVATRSIHVAAGTSLKHDASGRTGRNLPDTRMVKSRGAIQ